MSLTGWCTPSETDLFVSSLDYKPGPNDEVGTSALELADFRDVSSRLAKFSVNHPAIAASTRLAVVPKRSNAFLKRFD